MNAILTCPATAAEPEPQHDRVPDNPPQPPLPQREPGRTLATSSLVEDKEREDGERGFEPEPGPDARYRALGAYLLCLVRDGDRRAAAAGRRAPRTVAEMRVRLAVPTGRTGSERCPCGFDAEHCRGAVCGRVLGVMR
ncbi:hypothetical protein V1J52_25255 [Streptomyces sp. TRM 70351]|uniref:hypothetical protein n=1 Tax=Streptomyces sp. TRM 70351 TaxID=3116552 RepID=UPI002E7C112C|nr:hypothetical protein [Streptomyces sp. TRM 70351]MEE1931432.1 hypothetical protein [Streptomyces sp. TRM 70351]